MRLRALHTSGFLDISSLWTDKIVGPPLRVTLRPGQVIDLDDSYRSVAAINSGISSGLIQLVSYSNTDGTYVGVDQVDELIQTHNVLSSEVHGVEGEVAGTTDEQTISDKVITNYGEGVTILGSISGGTALNLVTGNVFTATVGDEITLSFTNPRATGIATSFVLILTNGGNFTVNWPETVYWPSATPPTLTTDGIDILTFITVNGGTIWHGTVAQAASSVVL